MEFEDPRRAVEAYLARTGGRAVDPRVSGLVPGFDAPFFQAGLAGYSDAAMRIVARRHGCPFCVTEALLDRTILAGGRGFAKADLGELEDNVPGGEEDHPLAGQIMGSDPREMAAAAVKMVEQGARSDRDYRKLAYEVDGKFPATEATRRQHLRLPGGEQIGFYEVGADGESAAKQQSSGAADVEHLDVGGVRGAERTFATIDVNLACPVKKIDRKARGGHWLAEPEGGIEILEAVREAVPANVLCTVKLRRSYDDTPEMAAAFEKVISAAFDIGYAWATVHGRTVAQKYIGPSRWDVLRDVVARHPGRLIFGSGDVWEAGDIFRMLAYTGVAGAAVARGCIGNPWIFRQAREMLAGREPSRPSIAEQRAVLEEHFRIALAVNGGLSRRAETYTGRTMRKFGIRFAAHHPRGEEVRKRMIAVASLADWQAVLEEWYAEADGGPRGSGSARADILKV